MNVVRAYARKPTHAVKPHEWGTRPEETTADSFASLRNDNKKATPTTDNEDDDERITFGNDGENGGGDRGV